MSNEVGQVIYTLVSRGSDVLAEYTDNLGNFETITRQLLSQIGQINETKSYVYPKEKYVFHYICENGLIYLCMADESMGKTIPFKFLDDIKSKFLDSFGNRAQNAHAFAFNADFQPIIKKLMNEVNDPRNNKYYNTNNKLIEIDNAIQETRNTVMEGIDKVLNRGERLEILVDRSNQLNDDAITFNRSAKKLKRRMLCKNIKYTFVLILIFALFLYLVISIFCGFGMQKCSKKK